MCNASAVWWLACSTAPSICQRRVKQYTVKSSWKRFWIQSPEGCEWHSNSLYSHVLCTVFDAKKEQTTSSETKNRDILMHQQSLYIPRKYLQEEASRFSHQKAANDTATAAYIATYSARFSTRKGNKRRDQWDRILAIFMHPQLQYVPIKQLQEENSGFISHQMAANETSTAGITMDSARFLT